MSSFSPTSGGDPDMPRPSAGPAESAGSRDGGSSGPGPSAHGYRPFVPLLLLSFICVGAPAFQCYQLVNERQTLATIYGNQNRPFEDSGKLRNSLDVIARETALLANSGNPGAKLIVDELARRGVTINAGAPPATPAMPAK